MLSIFRNFLLATSLAICYGTAPQDSSLVFLKGEGGYYCFKIPYLLRTASNTLIAWAEARGKDGRTTCDDWSGTDLVLKRSTDGGKSWGPLTLFYSNSTTNDTNVIGNAAPVQDSSTGTIWVPFCRNNFEVWLTYSTDDGNTWSIPIYQPQLTHSEDWKWIGLGPPAGLQLSTGRLLIPAYHTIKWEGDGCVSRGHTIYSDDHGVTWQLGNEDFGSPYFANECQAVQLADGSVMINARTISNMRVQVVSQDGGLTFGEPYIPSDLIQPREGCEGSIVRDPIANKLYFSDPTSKHVVRMNMTIFESQDDGKTWQMLVVVDEGSVAYSAMQVVPPSANDRNPNASGLEILYERANKPALVFDPDEIRYWRVF